MELSVALNPEVGPHPVLIGILVEPRQMGGDAGVEAADDVVEYLLIIA